MRKISPCKDAHAADEMPFAAFAPYIGKLLFVDNETFTLTSYYCYQFFRLAKAMTDKMK